MPDFLVEAMVSVAMTAGILKVLLVSGLAHRLAIDHPNERSLHCAPTPRCGGVAIMATLAAMTYALSEQDAIIAAVRLACALAAISWLDDKRGLSVLLRLTFHCVIAGIFLLQQPGAGPAAVLLSMFILVWGVNLFNFMDGANGLAGGMAVIGFSFYGLAAWLSGDMPLATVGMLVAASSLGFLFFNFGAASIFLGDVGSVPLGFLAGAVGYLGWSRGDWSALVPACIFLPFILDATLTIARRMLNKKQIWKPHREHYYQRLIAQGASHTRTALIYYAMMLASGCLGVFAAFMRVDYQWLLLLGAIAGNVAVFFLIDGLWRNRDKT